MGFLKTPNEAKIVPDQIAVAILELSPSSDDEVEEEVDVPLHLPENRPRKVGQAGRKRLLQALQEGITCRSCKVGRRWSRRTDNGVFLQNLLKGEEVCDDLLANGPSVFERLLADEKAMEKWESFTSQSEEEQHAFLTSQIALHRAKEKVRKERCWEDSSDKKPSEGKKQFKRVCPLVQEFLSSEHVPKGTLLDMEPCLIQFFLTEPDGEYVTNPLANNDRKVVHGLAQYLDLISESFNSQVSCGHRCTKVTNPKATFTAPKVLLSEFLGIRTETPFQELSVEEDESDNVDSDHISVTSPRKPTERSSRSDAPVSTPFRRRKLLLVADSHGKNLVQMLHTQLRLEFEVEVVTCPGAPFNYVAQNLVDMTVGFSREDHVVFMAGTNNCHEVTDENAINKFNLDGIAAVARKTNLHVFSIPFRFDCPENNSYIHCVNTELKKKVQHFNLKSFIDLSDLNKNNFTKHGLHLNRRGKYNLVKYLTKAVDSCNQENLTFTKM